MVWATNGWNLPQRARLAYRLGVDEWNGQQRLQMVVEAAG
jgi:single-stranded-DNA-specific exonuclease